MSIKPSVVFIKGVHSTTGPDKTSDIGFPQLELEKLFEGAASKEVGSEDTYSSGKKYIYYNPSNSQAVIQNEGHFNCIKNGYYSIADGVSHYYTLSGNNYNYNTVPDTNSWADKWSFSNAIKDKALYSISPESDRICINNNNYYEKSGNNYIKQSILTYNTYNKSLQVDWNINNKYIGSAYFDEETFEEVKVWKTNNGTIATSGYYLAIYNRSDNTYTVQLLNLTFNKGVYSGSIVFSALYKLSDDFGLQNNKVYIKNGNNFETLIVNQDGSTFTSDPADDSSFYLYQKGADWLYPNTEEPEYPILARAGNIYNSSSFPLYTKATITEISKPSYISYTIYEQSAVKVNYLYSGTDNSLKFVFTDKTIPEIIKVCGLPDNISLEKYVHLTNLNFNSK